MNSASYWLDALARASIQGALLALAVWLALRLFRQSRPETRCWIWVLVLAKFALSLCFVWKLAVLPPAAPPGVAGSVVYAMRPDSLPAAPEAPSPLLWLWLAGAACVAGWAGIGHVRLLRTLRASVPASDAIVQIARDLQGGEPTVRTHPDVPVPMISGVFRPVILVPDSFAEGLSEAEMRMVLAHELAHLERKDALARLFVFACQSLFFFHPAVWIARREWEIASESACDRWAIHATGATPHAYAAMLLKISVGPRRAPALALSVVPADKTLHRRIENMKITTQKSMLSRFGAIASILTVSALALPFALAEQEPRKEKPKPAPAKTEKAPIDFAKLEAALAEIRKGIEAGKLTHAQGQARLKELKQRMPRLDLSRGGYRVETTLEAGAKSAAQAELHKAHTADQDHAKAHDLLHIKHSDHAKADAGKSLSFQGKLSKEVDLAKVEGLISKVRLNQVRDLELAAVQGKLAKEMDLAKVEGLISKARLNQVRDLELAKAEGVISKERLNRAKDLELASVQGKLAKEMDLAKVEGLISKASLNQLRDLELAKVEGHLKERLNQIKDPKLAGFQGKLAKEMELARVKDMNSKDLVLQRAAANPLASERELSFTEIRDRLAAAIKAIKQAVEDGRMTPEAGKAQIEEFRKVLGGG